MNSLIASFVAGGSIAIAVKLFQWWRDAREEKRRRKLTHLCEPRGWWQEGR